MNGSVERCLPFRVGSYGPDVASILRTGPREELLSRRDVSDFAAKLLHIVAQGFSPGLCVARIRPESAAECL